MSNDKDKNKTALSAFDEAAGNDATTLVYKDVVDYKAADAETKAKMDVIIAAVNKAIESNDLTVITSIDQEPSERLGATSEAILREAQSAGSFLGSFGAFRDKIASFDFDGVGRMARDYSATVQRRMKLAALSFKESPFAYVVQRVAYFFTGMFGKKASTMDTLRHEIDKSLLQFGEVIADLEKARDKIPGAARNLLRQEDARIAAYSDYGLYIGATLEALRQWKEERIPAKEKEVAVTQSPLEMRNLRAQKLGMTVLNRKITDMDTFHKSCIVQLETIEDLKEALVMSELNINSHLTTSKGQWLAFMSEATSAATISTIAEANQSANQFGNRIFEQSVSLSDLTKNMSRACFENGALDAEKVVEFLKKKAENAVEGVRFIEEANRKFEQKRVDLDRAAKELHAAKAAANSPKMAQEAMKLLTHDKAAPLTIEGTATEVKVPAKPQKPEPQ